MFLYYVDLKLLYTRWELKAWSFSLYVLLCSGLKFTGWQLETGIPREFQQETSIGIKWQGNPSMAMFYMEQPCHWETPSSQLLKALTAASAVAWEGWLYQWEVMA